MEGRGQRSSSRRRARDGIALMSRSREERMRDDCRSIEAGLCLSAKRPIPPGIRPLYSFTARVVRNSDDYRSPGDESGQLDPMIGTFRIVSCVVRIWRLCPPLNPAAILLRLIAAPRRVLLGVSLIHPERPLGMIELRGGVVRNGVGLAMLFLNWQLPPLKLKL